MEDIAIKAVGLGKRYTVGKKVGYTTMRESLTSAFASTVGLFAGSARITDANDFWALKDATFEIKRGEAVGILGRNGAGKSTLLKVLSRITRPTEGYVDVAGRVGSLLEVGTGFHPELSGRENVFLNGAIMGLSTPEVRRQFDSIVAFADIEKFIDTPVKRYSSGMYTRLAFAVAAHMEPDILLVDEVLAVGDATFQKKCLGKMGDVAKSGRTVLFVSHQMGAITTLCDRAILLERGSVACIGNAAEVVSRYLNAGAERSGFANLTNAPARHGTGELRFADISLRDNAGTITPNFSIGDDIIIEFGLIRHQFVNGIRLAIQLTTSDGLNIAHMIDEDSGFMLTNAAERERLQVIMHDVRLYPGSYTLSLWIGDQTSTGTYDQIDHCIQFDIVGSGEMTARTLPRSAGLMFLTPEWKRGESDRLSMITADNDPASETQQAGASTQGGGQAIPKALST